MRQRVDKDGVQYVRLEAFLKLQGVAGTGGQAKVIVTQRAVQVNGETEGRRGRKLRQGDVVHVEGHDMLVDFIPDSPA